jgi:hypothetical protein
MSRTILVAVALAALALAPSAAAKGPHAIVAPGPGGIAPGERWVATLSLNEYSARALARSHPLVILRSGRDRLVVRAVRMSPDRYRLRAAFPKDGRWSYTVVDGRRRFAFPAAVIGSGERDTMAYVAFPKGSPAERQGAGGPYMDDASPAGGESLPPEVVVPAEGGGDGDGGGLAWWIPAAGLALAGAGTLTVVRQRR